MKWTNDKIELLKQLYPNSSWEILLTEFPVSQNTISSVANKNKIKRIVRGSNSYLKHDQILFDTWTEKSAYILGYLEADGCILNNKKEEPSIRVQFACSKKDEIFLEYLKEIVSFTGKITQKSYELGGKGTGGKIHQFVSFTVSSRYWKGQLEKNFRKQKVPEEISSNLLNHYIRGYFDGDGSVYKEKKTGYIRSNFVSSSFELMESIAKILRPITGSILTIYKKTGGKQCWYINLGCEATKKLGNWMYKEATFFLKRKKERFCLL